MPQAVEEAARHYAHMLLVHRMRTAADRAAVAAAFERAWGAPLPPQPRPSVAVMPGWARLGRARVPRAQLLDESGMYSKPEIPLSPFSQLCIYLMQI